MDHLGMSGSSVACPGGAPGVIVVYARSKRRNSAFSGAERVTLGSSVSAAPSPAVRTWPLTETELGDLDPGGAAGGEWVFEALVLVKDRGVETDILLMGWSGGAVGEATSFSALWRVSTVFALVVGRREGAGAWGDPDLEQVDGVGLGGLNSECMMPRRR